MEDGSQLRITALSQRDGLASGDFIDVSFEAKCRKCVGGDGTFYEPTLVQAFVDGRATPEIDTDSGLSGFVTIEVPSGACKHAVQLKATYGTCTACGSAWSKEERFYVNAGKKYATCDTAQPRACAPNTVGDPVDAALGRAFSGSVDVTVPGPFPVAFTRFHDSSRTAALASEPLGRAWFGPLFVSLDTSGAGSGRVVFNDEFGRSVHVLRRRPPQSTAGTPAVEWREEIDGIALTQSGSTWTLTHEDNRKLTFESGRLTQRRDRFGNLQTLTYDAGSPPRLVTVRDPFGRGIDLAWDAERELDTVTTVPGGIVIDYSVGPAGGRTFATLNAVTFPTEMGGTTVHAFTYTAEGRLVRVDDGAGRSLEEHAYFASGPEAGKVQSTAGPGGRPQYTFDYLAGRTIATDGSGQATTFDFDTSTGLVTRVTGNACGCGADWLQTDRDSAFHVIRETRPYPEGAPGPTTLVTEYRHDVRGRLTRWIEDSGGPDERAWDFEYANASFPFHATKRTQPSLGAGCAPLLRALTLTYDPRFPEATTVQLTGCSAAGVALSRTWTRVYDVHGRMTAFDGPETGTIDETFIEYWPFPGGPTLAEQQRAGYLKERRSPGGAHGALVVRNEAYDAAGRPSLVTDVNGSQTALAWGWEKVRFSTLLPALPPDDQPLVHELRYDDNGLLTRTILPKGNGTTYTYDDYKLLSKVTDDEGGVVEYLHDVMNRLETERRYDEATPATIAAQWDWRYDAKGRLWKEFDAGQDPSSPTARYWEHLYTSQGRLASIVDPDGVRRRTFDFDRHQRPERIAQRVGAGTDPADLVTTLAWDDQDNLVGLVDPRGLVTSRTFDDLGDLKSITSPDFGTVTIVATPGGQFQTITDSRGHSQVVSHDGEGRVTQVSFPTEPARNVQYFYDEPTSAWGRGRLTSATEPYIFDLAQVGTVRYHFERRGLLTLEEHLKTPVPPNGNYRENHVYDDNGNETQFGQFRWTFDLADRPKTVECFVFDGVTGTWQPDVSSVTYAPAGPATTIAFANGRTDTRQHDEHARPRRWTVGGTPTLIDYEYQWTDGLLTNRIDHLASGRDIAYTFDDFDRLDHADTGAGLWGAGDFDVDKNANTTRIQLGAQVTDLVYEATTNRLASAVGYHPKGPMAFDAMGNVLADGGPNTYAYTHADRTATVANASGTYTFQYGPLGTLRGLAPADPNAFYQHRYLFGGDGLPTTEWGNGQAYTRYAYLNGAPISHGRLTLSAIPDAPAWLIDCFSYHADPFGTVHAMTRDDGSVAWQADYTPYGDIHQLVVSEESSNLRFLGHLASAELGLSINGFRLAEPTLGRYTQVDPLGLHANDLFADGANLASTYGFADANPVVYGDPIGLYTKPCHANLTLVAGRDVDLPCLERIACKNRQTDGHPIWGVGGAANWGRAFSRDNLHFQEPDVVRGKLAGTLGGDCSLGRFARQLHYLQDATGPHLGGYHDNNRPGPDICPGVAQAQGKLPAGYQDPLGYIPRDQGILQETEYWLRRYGKDCSCKCGGDGNPGRGAACLEALTPRDWTLTEPDTSPVRSFSRR